MLLPSNPFDEALTERNELMSPHRTPAKPHRPQISGLQVLWRLIQTSARVGLDRPGTGTNDNNIISGVPRRARKLNLAEERRFWRAQGD